jgi:hypothetical protein
VCDCGQAWINDFEGGLCSSLSRAVLTEFGVPMNAGASYDVPGDGNNHVPTALNGLTVSYARTLADDGIKITALAPGLRRTDLSTAARQRWRPGRGGGGRVRLALLPDDGHSGEFFSWDGTRSPVPGATSSRHSGRSHALGHGVCVGVGHECSIGQCSGSCTDLDASSSGQADASAAAVPAVGIEKAGARSTV